MRKVTFIALIGISAVVAARLFKFIVDLRWIFDGGVPFFYILGTILGIIGWGLIGYFFYALYKKQPK